MNIEFTPESRIVIVMRGVPGAGKSTNVSALIRYIGSLETMPSGEEWFCICSADHFFTNKRGEYRFNPRRLSVAHQACRSQFDQALAAQRQLIIVDNTNIMSEHVQPYVDMALEHGYEVFQWEATGQYESIHNVPEIAVNGMRTRYQQMSLDNFIPGTALNDFLPGLTQELDSTSLKV